VGEVQSDALDDDRAVAGHGRKCIPRAPRARSAHPSAPGSTYPHDRRAAQVRLRAGHGAPAQEGPGSRRRGAPPLRRTARGDRGRQEGIRGAPGGARDPAPVQAGADLRTPRRAPRSRRSTAATASASSPSGTASWTRPGAEADGRRRGARLWDGQMPGPGRSAGADSARSDAKPLPRSVM
jgi:hypothetical protein